MSKWLLDQLVEAGNDSKPRFAFLGTVNFMRAMAILVSDDEFNDQVIIERYRQVSAINDAQQERVASSLGQMLMAIHHHAALASTVKNDVHGYDNCRAAIISWYYSIYFSASAMIAAKSGVESETHAGTARAWQADFSIPKMAVRPFEINTPGITSEQLNKSIRDYRGDKVYALKDTPVSKTDAWLAVCSYFSGTCKREQEISGERVRSSKEFKKSQYKDFRTKAARSLRDSRLSGQSANFITMSFRCRGKANYRDTVFLTYGDDNYARVRRLHEDLTIVSGAFQRMASRYLRARLGRKIWEHYISDLEENSRLSVSLDYVSW